MTYGRSAGFVRFLAAGLVLAAVGERAAAAAEVPESQVTVEGHRQRLERRVHDFVVEITSGGPDASLQRWTGPVCPLVAGLTAEQGEGVLRRVTQMASKAGAKLAPAHCEPNLVIVVTPDPPALIEAWRSRTQGKIFNGAAPMTVRHFIETSQPVRVWYNTEVTSEDGARLSSPSLLAPVSGTTDPVPVNNQADDTRLALPALTNFGSVILIVDARSLQHLKVGQLADYVGMVGLGRLDTHAHTTDAPTILNLFTSTDQESLPAGLTEWDEAYLHALYHTRMSSRMQRSEITRSLVHELEKSEK